MRRKSFILIIVLIIALLPVCTATAAYRVNTSWLKAHSKPDHNSTVVDSYRRDFAVTILRTYKGGWARVRFLPSGNSAYVRTKYLAKSKTYKAYISKDSTIIRSGPANSFKSIGKLNKGAEVRVLSHGSAYDYVSTSKGKGYIRNTYLTSSKPNGRTAYIKNPRNRTVNLRKGPGKGYKVIAEYRPGTKITLLHRGSSWCKVSVRGKTGYIMRKYISLE